MSLLFEGIQKDKGDEVLESCKPDARNPRESLGLSGEISRKRSSRDRGIALKHRTDLVEIAKSMIPYPVYIHAYIYIYISTYIYIWSPPLRHAHPLKTL